MIINIKLSSKDIGRAIKEVEKYKSDINRKLNTVRERVATLIAQECQTGFANAQYDDVIGRGYITPNVDVSIENDNGLTLVIASGREVAFIEFGAGVYHNGPAGTSPHPSTKVKYTIGSYGKGKGKQKTWVYYNNGDKNDKVFTHGTPASMPMWNAVQNVRPQIESIVREVFND